jgi:type IV pilus assembly protein PilM
VVRFRLKKLLPFDVDEAVVSYQVMASAKGSVQVVAVAVPTSVLDEYEGVVTAAGYLPGAVLPSTLAALAGLDETEASALVVNAGPNGVTTAIVKGGILLLHRSVDMAGDAAPTPATVSLVDRENSAQEWAQQEPVGPGGGYDRFEAEAAMQTQVLEKAEIREMAAGAATREVTQAVSVAAAYFEDTLQVAPEVALSAGTMGAEMLATILQESGLEGLRVREMVDAGMLEAGAVTASVSRGWLAGVRGALKN